MAWRLRCGCHAASRAAALALMVAVVPLPLSAADAASRARTKTPTLKESVAQVAAGRDVATAPKATAARASRQTPAAASTPGFFKTRPGMVALAVMIAGTGYAVYSAQHDRIHSPGKK